MRRFLACCLLFAACAESGDSVLDETEVSPELDGKADTSSELSVRVGDTTLTVNKVLTRRDSANGSELVLRGKTPRNITDGRGFIIDDIYGDFAQKSARVFELTWSLSSARTLTDGVDQFIGLSFVHSSSRPDSLTGHVIVRPRLATFTGSSKIYVTAELTPVVYGGTVVYRIAGHTVGANTGIRAVSTASRSPTSVVPTPRTSRSISRPIRRSRSSATAISDHRGRADRRVRQARHARPFDQEARHDERRRLRAVAAADVHVDDAQLLARSPGRFARSRRVR